MFDFDRNYLRIPGNCKWDGMGSYTGMQSHFRINIATPRENLAEAIRRLKTCF